MTRRLSRFWRDRRGVSAVEFALIAPVLIIFYFGMAEMTQAMLAQRRLSHLTASIGDIVARDQQLTDARRDDLFSVGNVLMSPFPTSTLRLCLVSIVSDANGKDVVAWSDPSNAPVDCPARNAVLDIPVSVLPAGKSVIMSKASYEYNSVFKFMIPQALTFRRTYYLKPRLSEQVTRVK
ncbi:TadE/TadG family type IV pilus assembly protein [Caulobacter sp. LjRoot300]|uniref:TadE/TadG family type IV pilus assembly protein n=1 Tax=Caulobacter sp. LjRoot300 TaxID=3342321 RepID=UPI003ED15897